MASTTQNTTTPASTKTSKAASANDSVKSIADALAALPKETEQTMKEFLDQQMANAKNMNDELVEQFGSAIDNSDVAASMNEVKEVFRKKAENDKNNVENEKQQETFAKIQNDLDRILEIQGEALRADAKRDETIYNDRAVNEVEEKSDEKVDDETDVVKEDVKPVEVKVDVQLPEAEKEPEKEDVASNVPSNEENLLKDIVSGQTEQNTLLNDIGQKLSDVNPEDKVDETSQKEPSKEENLLNDLVSAQAEQNSLLNDIGKKLPDIKDDDADDNTPKEPSKEEGLLGDIASAQTEQNALLNDIGQKLSDVDNADVPQQEPVANDAPTLTETAFAEVNENLGKINTSIDDMLEELGDSVANTDVNEPQPITVNVDVKQPEKDTEKEQEETTPKTQSVELAEDSLNSIRELVDTSKQNEEKLLETMNKRNAESKDNVEQFKQDSMTELANDISGATDAMNTQDETKLDRHEDEQSTPDDDKRIEQAETKQDNRFDEDTKQVAENDEQPMVLDRRMDIAERAERDITPALNEVQMFNRMSLTKEEILVLASEIGKAVRENLVDRDAEKKREAARLDEVERILRG